MFCVISGGLVRSQDEMITARGRTWRPVAALVAVVVALVGTPIGSAGADHVAYANPENKLGWSACAWPAGATVQVSVDPAFPFPNTEYVDRLVDAVIRWNLALRTAGRAINFTGSGAEEAEILLQYRPVDGPDSADVLGETYLRRAGDADFTPNIGRCPDRRPTASAMAAAQIRISPREDWFTGPDSSVDTWQMCEGLAFRQANGAVCDDQVDFASTVLHELGHTLVFYHPQTLDDIDGVPVDRSDSASSAAACVEATGVFAGQATMCAGQGAWRAEQRTLETWDVETAHRNYG